MSQKIRFSTRARLSVALAVVVAILGTLIGTAISKASTYYLTVGELEGRGTQAIGAPETVSGVIVKKSVTYDAATGSLQFRMQDPEPSSTSKASSVTVSFHGPEPDDFNYGWPVIVTGTLVPNQTFTASKLLVKCPSKYQAQSKTYDATSQ